MLICSLCQTLKRGKLSSGNQDEPYNQFNLSWSEKTRTIKTQEIIITKTYLENLPLYFGHLYFQIQLVLYLLVYYFCYSVTFFSGIGVFFVDLEFRQNFTALDVLQNWSIRIYNSLQLALIIFLTCSIFIIIEAKVKFFEFTMFLSVKIIQDFFQTF